MWTQTIDLHSHSTHSDGQHDVAQVADLMAQHGVKMWALTDHDTTDGWLTAAREAERQSIRFVPGVEITCEPALPANTARLEAIGREQASASWHLLAFFPQHQPHLEDVKVNEFKRWLTPKQDGRTPRMEAMCRRLAQFGMPVEFEAVMKRAGGSVGRPHLAEEMVERGYVMSKQEAFEKWIGDGLPCFVPHLKPTLRETVDAVHRAGGITSLAHPLYYGVETSVLLKTLVEHGVDAIEAVHRSHDDAYRHELMQAASQRGLFITVGSDFHGLDQQPRPGNMPVIVSAVHPAFFDEV